MSRLGRLLQAAPTRALLQRAGDAVAALCAVVGALWSWSTIDGYPLTAEYVRSHAGWFALGVVWLLLLQPPFTSRPAAATRDTAAIVARTVVSGMGIYLVLYFLAPRDLLPRLVVLNFLAFASISTLVWRVVYGHLFADDTRPGRGAPPRADPAVLRRRHADGRAARGALRLPAAAALAAGTAGRVRQARVDARRGVPKRATRCTGRISS